MKPISKFDYYFGGWIWFIRYKIANFVIGYNIEDALEEHYELGVVEGKVVTTEKELSKYFSNARRIEVIDKTGRVYVKYNKQIDLTFQDHGATLKVFVNDNNE